MKTMATESKKMVASLFSVLLLVIFVVAVARVEKSETAKLRFISALAFRFLLFRLEHLISGKKISNIAAIFGL